MLEFSKRILFVGYGYVAQCTLPVLLKHIAIPPSNITVMDFEDKQKVLGPYIAQGVRWVQGKISPDNLGSMLEKYVSAGDMLIDLAWNIDGCEMVDWCHQHGVLYINTSLEVWDPYLGAESKHPTTRTLYWRHMKMRRLIASWKEAGPTAILEHGANPGLISHWTKKGLIDIGNRMLEDDLVVGAEADEMQELIADRAFNLLAMKTGVKVIHCSERDTQITNRPKEIDEFVNTWSIEGFREEGITTAELGWGTHEKQLPPLAFEHEEGPRNQICLARMGMNTWVVSWVPHYCIRGMIIRHGEAFTISDKLTVWDGDKVVYRPTVHYAYCPCDAALVSLDELRSRDYHLQLNLRIMTDEIIRGADILGSLLMGHPYNSWWTGSLMSIEKARSLVPHQNATTMQVAISVVAAAMWAIENPESGVQFPENLPYDYVLNIVDSFIGPTISIPSDWTPLKHYVNHFDGFNSPNLDWEDPWQFQNFIVTDGD